MGSSRLQNPSFPGLRGPLLDDPKKSSASLRGLDVPFKWLYIMLRFVRESSTQVYGSFLKRGTGVPLNHPCTDGLSIINHPFGATPGHKALLVALRGHGIRHNSGGKA